MDVLKIKAMVLIPKEKELIVFRKYSYELFLALLLCAITWLSFKIEKTDKKADTNAGKMEKYLTEDRVIVIQALNNSTQAINQSTEVIKTNGYILSNLFPRNTTVNNIGKQKN